MLSRLFLTLIAVGVICPLLFAWPASTHALSCLPLPENLLEHGDVIFAGTVESITRAPDEDDGNFGMRAGGTATFAVSKYWKGNPEATVTVNDIYAWATEGPFFKVGMKYIVFARAATTGTTTLSAGIDCGSTAVATTETEAALDKLTSGRAPVTPLPVKQFSRNLTLGDTGSDVAMLQSFLEDNNLLVMPAGVAKGYFGGLTEAALSKYQASEGIAPAYGYFGPVTRERVMGDMMDHGGGDL